MSENSYLALREAKIARNLARLQELGLGSPFSKTATPLLTNEDTLSKSAQNATTLNNADETISGNQPLRRSKRKRSQSQIQEDRMVTTAVEPKASSSSSTAATNGMSTRLRRTAIEPAPLKFEMTPTATTTFKKESSRTISASKSSSSFPPCSARAMSIDVRKLLHGDGTQGGVLGKQLNETGKAHVMHVAASLGVRQYSGGISFNKYSGVQEWGNQVLFLWINLNSPSCQVVNDFMDQGRRVVWYGGSRMHDETAVIQTLKRVGSDVAKSKHNHAGAVILWCRIYDHEQRSFTPYTCLGRLSLHSYDPSASPLAFVWNLMDYQYLKEQGVLDRFIYKNSDVI